MYMRAEQLSEHERVVLNDMVQWTRENLGLVVVFDYNTTIPQEQTIPAEAALMMYWKEKLG